MKYVMAYVKTREPAYNRYVFLIFPDQLVHSIMAEHFRRSLAEQITGDISIVSAGFITDDRQCYGKSESLKLKAHRDDTSIVRSFPYQHGLNFAERK